MNKPIESSLPVNGERFLPGMPLSIHLEHMHRYVLAREIVTGKTVLDIASGEGYGSVLLASVAAQVTGVDIDPAAVAHANQKYVRHNLTYKEGSAAAIPLPDASVDVVVSFETIEHHDQHEEMMREIKRVLKPNGVMMMSSPDKLNFADIPQHKNEFHVKELYEAEFKELMGRYFKNATYYGQRLAYGSVIMAEEAPAALVNYRDDGAVERRPGLLAPVYHVVIASDSLPLPVLPSGVFEKPIDVLDYDMVQMIKKENENLKTEVKRLASDINELLAEREDIEKARLVTQTLTKKIAELQLGSEKLLNLVAMRDAKITQLQQQVANSEAGMLPVAATAEYYDPKWIDELNAGFKPTSDTAVLLHLYYEDLIEPIFSGYLDGVRYMLDVIITMPPKITTAGIEAIRQRFPNSYFIPVENRGRDIRPFAIAMPLLKQMGYKQFCKIHTKKSPHLVGGDKWRDALIGTLLRSPKEVEAIIELFRREEKVGLLVPDFANVDASEPDKHEGNLKWLPVMLERIGRSDLIGNYKFNFPAGSMYWGRVDAILPLITGNYFSLDDFVPEAGQLDGEINHCIERLIGLIVERSGYVTGSIKQNVGRGMA